MRRGCLRQLRPCKLRFVQKTLRRRHRAGEKSARSVRISRTSALRTISTWPNTAAEDAERGPQRPYPTKHRESSEPATLLEPMIGEARAPRYGLAPRLVPFAYKNPKATAQA